MGKKVVHDKVNMLSPVSLNLKGREEDGRWEYFDRLNAAINDDDGYNIAISGTYGTGKSSIVKTYINEYQMQGKVLNINIGSFLKTLPNNNNNNSVNDNEDNSDMNNEVLSEKEEILMQKVEKNIMKQLIYTTKYSKSKLSSIPRLQGRWQRKYLLYSLAIVYMIICLYYFIVDKVLITRLVQNFINVIKKIKYFSNISLKSFLPFFKILLLIDILFILIMFIYYLFIVFNKAKAKIKVKNYELEIDGNSSAKFSFMDNLYEILYSFMNSSVEVVFFEDIDRYPRDVCIKIIEDLKELNSIINGCNGMNNKERKKVVFVYSFKDSIFYKYTEKNKFYDYILSIMPVSTRYNSLMHLINELNAAGINFNDINGSLLNITFLHITDMRTIKNIVNDFSLFIKVLKLDKDKMDINQLFALCVYKNFDIEGYDRLLDYDNPIYSILSNLEKIIEEEVDNDRDHIKAEISKLQKRKVDKKESIFSFNKVNDVLPQCLIVDDKEITHVEFMSDKFDVSSLNGKNIYIKVNNNKFDFNYETSISDFINFIDQCDDKIAEYNLHLKKLDHVFDDEDNNDNLFNYSRNYYNDVLVNKKILNSRISKDLFHSLAFELVYSGYIRFDYIDYITAPVDSEHFSLYDSRFIFGYNHQRFDFNAKVDHPDRIINYLGNNCLSSPYVLNNSILRYIYNDSVNLDKKNLINQFNNVSDEKLEFLSQLRKKEITIYNKIINELANNFDKIWDDCNKKLNNNMIKNSYNSIIVELYLLSDIDISNIRNTDKLKSIVNHYADKNNVKLISFENDNKVICKKTINNLKKLDIHFLDINKIISDNKDMELDIIVKEDLFELNKGNVLTIINNEHGVDNVDKLDYEMMKTSKYADYFRYSIDSHLDKFSLNIYLIDDKNKFIIGDTELIRYLLTKSDDEFLIKEILKRETFIIDNYKIPIKYINIAYEYKHIYINWKTINIYSEGLNSVDDNLFNLAFKNIESFYNKNTNVIGNISPEFIKKLINGLYKVKKYSITDIILNNYDNNKLEQYNVYITSSLVEVEQKVKHNLILFSRPNFNKISRIVSRETLYMYTRNLLKNGDIGKIIDLIDEKMLVDLNDCFSNIEKVVILNKIIKRKILLDNSINEIMASIFDSNTLYSIPYRKEYMENIFDVVKDIFVECVHANGMIKFRLK